MAELAAQTVEELDFDTPDAIADQPGEPALAAGPTENTPAAEVEEAIEGPTRSGGSRGRAVRGRGGARGGKAKTQEPYVPDAPAARDRLTEDELSAKMEAMRLRNAELQAKRDAAIQDENEYSVIEEQARKEQEAARKEQEALKARTKEIQKAIDAEREASAARKLKKLTGREWDREKTEDDWNPAYSTSSQDDPVVDAPRSDRTIRGRGRGRGRASRGRPSYPEPARKKQPQQPPAQADIHDEKQFPALNASAKAFEPATPPNEDGAASVEQPSQKTTQSTNVEAAPETGADDKATSS